MEGLEIWELALIPSILNNAETWTNIDEEAIKKLESLQNLMFRGILSTPKSTPSAFINWDLGLIKMSNRIIMKKLNFYHHLLNLPDNTLAKQMPKIQIENDGLV